MSRQVYIYLGGSRCSQLHFCEAQNWAWPTKNVDQNPPLQNPGYGPVRGVGGIFVRSVFIPKHGHEGTLYRVVLLWIKMRSNVA